MEVISREIGVTGGLTPFLLFWSVELNGWDCGMPDEWSIPYVLERQQEPQIAHSMSACHVGIFS